MTEESFARFEGQVALVTAAASGICRASAEMIAAEGGTIAAVDNNREQLDGAMEAFAAAGGGPHHAYPADALQPREVDTVVADVADRFGKIDILLNGVGGSTAIPNPAATTEQLTQAGSRGVQRNRAGRLDSLGPRLIASASDDRIRSNRA